MIKRGQKRKETALNDRNLPLKTSSSQSFYPLRVFGENSSQCNFTGRLENVEMRRTDAQFAKSLISFQNSYSLSMLTFSNMCFQCTYSNKNENTVLSMLGTGYFLKIAKINSQQEKQSILIAKNSPSKTEKNRQTANILYHWVCSHKQLKVMTEDE